MKILMVVRSYPPEVFSGMVTVSIAAEILAERGHDVHVLVCRPGLTGSDERRDGVWYFKSRKPQAFYAADVLEHPLRVEARFHFPGNSMIGGAVLPERWESWQRFWAVGEHGSSG